ncbi:uncharacterized protein TM35_000082650 [Trypanosoma theileri]|uniref:Uncharacterized protein n=1 Tax=Trypanosoma theileri TaxID=67003 RepID=A0A1X0P0K2_9TRYP|nr:uncharacterized protein TM35_000082650 [Trypanosoma theileri]ORC90467.1 hypothetical protein TM35_000082650 [Trypanosoma theileri]
MHPFSLLEHSVDAALQHRLDIIKQQQEKEKDENDENDEIEVLGQSSISPVWSYATPPAKRQREILFPHHHTITETTTIDANEDQDDIEQLLRDAFSLAASHSAEENEIIKLSFTQSSENIYRDAMLRAYHLYGEIENCFDDSDKDFLERCCSSDNKKKKEKRPVDLSTALMELLESPAMQRERERKREMI